MQSLIRKPILNQQFKNIYIYYLLSIKYIKIHFPRKQYPRIKYTLNLIYKTIMKFQQEIKAISSKNYIDGMKNTTPCNPFVNVLTLRVY